MAWSGETSETKSNITTSEVFTANIPLNPGELAVVAVDFDPVASPTDDLICNVYGSIDGTNFDDTPVRSIVIDKDKDPNQISFIVRNRKNFRIGVLMSGSTDTLSDATITWITNGLNL